MDKPAGYGRGECTATNVEGGERRSPPIRGNLERKTPYLYQVLTIWIVHSTLKELLEGVAQAGCIYERVDGLTCSRRH
jgi:hypothetical protein